EDASPAPLPPRRANAASRGSPREPIAHEHVAPAIGVEQNEIRRETLERGEARVAGERGDSGRRVPLEPRGADADALGRAGPTIVDEHVARAVRVERDEIARRALEPDPASIGTDRGSPEVARGV